MINILADIAKDQKVEQQNYIVPANSFLCRKIKVIGLAKERC